MTFRTNVAPVDQADEVVDGRLGAAAAHLVEEAVVGDQKKWTSGLMQVVVKLS